MDPNTLFTVAAWLLSAVLMLRGGRCCGAGGHRHAPERPRSHDETPSRQASGKLPGIMDQVQSRFVQSGPSRSHPLNASTRLPGTVYADLARGAGSVHSPQV